MFSHQILTIFILSLVLSSLALPYAVSSRMNLWSWLMVYFGPVMALSLTVFSFVTETPLKVDLYISQIEGLSVGFYLDILSGFILSFVLVIGAIVVCFSYRYLEMDLKRKDFLRSTSYTLCAVTTMLLSNNFIQFFIFWVLTSYFLHKLLTHVPNDKEALNSARQKFWISRLGDLFLVIAISIYYIEFQTFSFVNFSELTSVNDFRLELIGFLLVLGAITKSAQWPFHFWLPNTMNTPTPVSAIMHAGIINSGGYLLIRMSPLLNQTLYSLPFLATIGALTAFLGVMMMWAQTDIKKSLAYSTISQMGFMMLQIGVGAYGLALVHMLGHALYKAYSFLTIGQSVDYGRLNRIYRDTEKSNNPSLLFYAALGLFLIVILYVATVGLEKINSQSLVLTGILFFGLIQTFSLSKNVIDGFLNCLLISTLYGVLFFTSGYIFASILASNRIVAGWTFYLNLILIFSFGILFWVQKNFNHLKKNKFFKNVYVKMLNGF